MKMAQIWLEFSIKHTPVRKNQLVQNKWNKNASLRLGSFPQLRLDFSHIFNSNADWGQFFRKAWFKSDFCACRPELSQNFGICKPEIGQKKEFSEASISGKLAGSSGNGPLLRRDGSNGWILLSRRQSGPRRKTRSCFTLPSWCRLSGGLLRL